MGENNNCPFCAADKRILENDLAFCLFDINPISKGHMLIIPKRHVESYFDCTDPENQSLFALINEAKSLLDREHHPAGFNVNVNDGSIAGQIVMHAHMHLIPRYNDNE